MGGAVAGKVPTLMQRFLPVEAIPVIIPVGFAAVLFAGMMTRVTTVDPDRESVNIAGLGNVKRDESNGESFRQHIRGFFTDRIKMGNTSIFPNAV